MSVLKQLEADYRHDISANRMKRLQEDARREQNRLDDAEARRELGKAMTIWAAAYNGQLARVEYLIETHAAGPNEWDPNNDNVTPLHLASSQNHVEVARYLLGKGADPNIKAGHLNATPLHWGSKLGHVEIVHLLYKAGADPTIRDGGGFNCLQLALSSGQPGCVAYLVAVMGDLFQAAHFGIIERMVYLLENKFYHVDETADATGKGVTALHLSCVGGHMKCIEYLIDKGATVDVKAGNVGSTPLMWATRAGQLPAVRCLVESGADPRYRDANGYSALNFAQQLRPPRVDIVQFFVKECGLDASDALPPALAGVVESDDVADEDDYAEMDEIEMQAEAKLKEELEGLSKEEVSAFYGATMRKGGVDSLTTLQVQLERAETSESISSQGAKFDPYNVSAKMDPICLAVIKTTHVPRSADELPLTTVGGVVKVLRKFEDLWNLGEIDETTELPDGNSLLRRRRGIYPSGYCTEHSWGEVVAGVKR
jgi:ankyrin repeat protein